MSALRFILLEDVLPSPYYQMSRTMEEAWPRIIKIDEGPAVIDRPAGWAFHEPEDRYVVFQGFKKDGHHEYIHVPLSRAGRVKVYSLTAAFEDGRVVMTFDYLSVREWLLEQGRR